MIQHCANDASRPPVQNVGIAKHLLIVASEAFAITWMSYEIPFRVLPEQVFSWRIVQEYHLKPADLEGIDVLVLYRCFQGSTLSLVRLAKLKKIKVIYELDDDLLDPPTDQSWGERYRNSHLSQIIKMFLSQVDLVKAGSPELARRLKERGYPAIYQPYAAKTCELPVETYEYPYRVGYFGSPHHQDDIEMVFPVLLASKELFQEQIEFEFIGCYPQNWQQLQARIFPYEPDYEIFLDFLAGRRWSLGLAPLRKNSFNEAKSNSKFRDLTTAGILGIYADLAPYRGSVVHGENGWLTKESPEEWYETIKRALSCSERSTMIHQARKLLQTIYSPEAVARNWVLLIKELNK
jgi:glycosyltransferase involved in cell wall biosynthesis